MSLSIKDFQPMNQWSIAPNIDPQEIEELPDLIDETTHRRYRNEPKWLIRFKCTLLAAASPIFQTTGGCLCTAWKIVKLISLSHFWRPLETEKRYDIKGRLHRAASDVTHIFTLPFALLGLEFSALYGLIRPYDGRKLYASCERALYGRPFLAPCFHPRLAEGEN